MSANEISFRIGGEAGQGVESSGAGFCTALTRAGLQVIGVPSYYERIRGGHNFYSIRAANREEPVWSVRENVDVLIALNAETVAEHHGCLNPGGVIIVDEQVNLGPLSAQLEGRDLHLLAVPIKQIAVEHGGEVMTNTAALGIAAAVTGFDVAHMISVIEDNFRSKGERVVDANRAVAQEAYDLAQARYGLLFRQPLGRREAPPRLSLHCNHAFAMGALVGGCKFLAGYPMTPWSSVLEYLAGHAAEWGLVVKHAEDEIAAVNMAVGAAYAGVRAMTGSSGGGFDLMVEGLSLAAMTETPLVVLLSQRPGPATGLSTRTAQGDLFMAIYASHGEFPRIVLAPHTPEEHFYVAARALNLADKYQCLVIVLSDHYFANTVVSCDRSLFDLDAVINGIERGKWLTPEQLDEMDDYKRFALTEDGISPRVIPGSHPKAVFLTSSNEHREDGHITEDPRIVVAMANKRLGKRKAIAEEMRPPLRYGPEQADLTLVSWGSSYGPVREAVNVLNASGQSANMVQFVDLWPFPAQAAREALAGARRAVVAETNITGQLAHLIETEAGIAGLERMRKYDGRPFTYEYILAHLED
jgi:2-oxoglutarate ferredoxin oxidoreductase subunit alpha